VQAITGRQGETFSAIGLPWDVSIGGSKRSSTMTTAMTSSSGEMTPYIGSDGRTVTTLRDSLFSTVPGSPVYLAKASHNTLLLFLVAWQAMIAAMMLPSSLPMIRLFDRLCAGQVHHGVVRAAFLGGHVTVWTVFGAVAFVGDTACTMRSTPSRGCSPGPG
jgi:predicted metal-binding membrane protein